jgi:hypothetical protein
MYVIQFKSRGIETTVWSGYATREEARRDAKEADLLIPIAWTWDILTEEELARQYEEEYYEKKETA